MKGSSIFDSAELKLFTLNATLSSGKRNLAARGSHARQVDIVRGPRKPLALCCIARRELQSCVT
jgi:hypothetical protein